MQQRCWPVLKYSIFCTWSAYNCSYLWFFKNYPSDIYCYQRKITLDRTRITYCFYVEGVLMVWVRLRWLLLTSVGWSQLGAGGVGRAAVGVLRKKRKKYHWVAGKLAGFNFFSPFSPPSHSLSSFLDCTFLNQLLFESYRIFTSPRSAAVGRNTAGVAPGDGVARWRWHRRGRHCKWFNCCYSTLRRGIALKAL